MRFRFRLRFNVFSHRPTNPSPPSGRPLAVARLSSAIPAASSSRVLPGHAGLVPRQYESGMMKRQGRISKEGPGLLRRLLVQVAWGMERRSRRVRALFAQLSRGQKTRRKQAAVAVARKILIWCWAMLRDGTTWREDGAPA